MTEITYEESAFDLLAGVAKQAQWDMAKGDPKVAKDAADFLADLQISAEDYAALGLNPQRHMTPQQQAKRDRDERRRNLAASLGLRDIDEATFIRLEEIQNA